MMEAKAHDHIDVGDQCVDGVAVEDVALAVSQG
jgi:hypothetical protein